MKKLIWLLLLLLIPCVVYPADVIINGKVGTVIPDKLILDTAYYKADATISDTILMGRAIVDAYRARQMAAEKTVMSEEDYAATCMYRFNIAVAKLKTWGFKGAKDLYEQSFSADIKAGIPLKDRWK